MVARLTSRSWCCDPYLSRIADQVVRAPTSVVQLVRNSEVWRRRYSRNVRDLQHNPIWKVAIRGLNAALHRFHTAGPRKAGGPPICSMFFRVWRMPPLPRGGLVLASWWVPRNWCLRGQALRQKDVLSRCRAREEEDKRTQIGD